MDTFIACTECQKVNRVNLANIAKGPKCGSCGNLFKLAGYASESSAAGLKNLIAKSPIPLVVDFWAPWCEPCHAFAPVFENASRTWGAGLMAFIRVNTEQFPMAGDLYNIRSIPTILVFKGGLEKERVSGAFNDEQFHKWVDAVLSG